MAVSGLELHEACTVGDCDSLEEYILSGRYDVNTCDPEWQNRTPLHWACARGYIECVRLLLENGALGTARMTMGWTPAHCAAEAGKVTVLRMLHTMGISIDRKDKYGDTPRRVAELYGHMECAKFLIIAEVERKEAQPDEHISDSEIGHCEEGIIT